MSSPLNNQKIMNLIERNNDVITGESELELLHSFEQFPVFMGCTYDHKSSDLFVDMNWHINSSSGMIQLNPLVPLDIIYVSEHGAGTVGGLWLEHHKEFAKFISRFSPKNVIEIGGGHGELSRLYNEFGTSSWTIVEPNPSPAPGVTATYIKGFFDDKFTFTDLFDTVVHSHVFEHMFNPSEFIQQLGNFIQPGKQMIFSIPNMQIMLERKYTNCINFEHTVFLTETYVDYYISQNGFKLIEKQYFKEDHSIFYAVEKDMSVEKIKLPIDLYEKNKSLFLEYILYYKEIVDNLNQTIRNCTQPVYLFSAHVFSQYLLAFGLDEKHIICLLDNDPNKQGKRLYGTDLEVYSPKILSEVKNPVVILRAGVYNKEIREDIITNINHQTVFLEGNEVFLSGL
jgi:SAM-dependent methyltransferase